MPKRSVAYNFNISNMSSSVTFIFNDTSTTAIYTLSLHDALPIFLGPLLPAIVRIALERLPQEAEDRSEEHTSELQSLRHLVCRLLLEKKNKTALKSKSQQRA